MTAAPGAPARPFVGIQMAPISLVDEGVEHVLDLCRERAGASAILYGAYSFSYANVGRAAEAYPDHGVHERFDLTGGAYFETHQEVYAGTILKGFRAPEPEFAGRDVLQETIEAARARDMAVYAWFFEAPPAHVSRIVPNYAKVLETDALGRPGTRPCFNHPDYRAHILSYVEDVLKHYEVAGLMWAAERRGPLVNVLLSGDVAHAVCFCPHCRAAGRARGIDPERARQGYLALARYVAGLRLGERPVEGAAVPFLRLLLEHHEILGWEHLWTRSKHAVRAAIYGAAKAIDPRREVGWHLWHQRSFSPLLRAEVDYADFAPISDWIKPVVYDNPAGVRFWNHVLGLHRSVLGDLDPAQIAGALYRVNGLEEGPLESLPAAGWSPDYVARETRLAAARVGPNVPVYAGIGLNIPAGPGGKQTTPEDAHACTLAAIHAGARGIVVSRQYCEMELGNLDAVGAALREAGWR